MNNTAEITLFYAHPIIQTLFGLALTLSVVTYLDPPTQGIYYSIAFLSSVVVIFDLGLGHRAIFEAAKTVSTGEKKITNSPQKPSRLQEDIARGFNRVFLLQLLISTIVAYLLVVPLTIRETEGLSPTIIALSILLPLQTSVVQSLNGFMGVRHGSGDLKSAAIYRLTAPTAGMIGIVVGSIFFEDITVIIIGLALAVASGLAILLSEEFKTAPIARGLLETLTTCREQLLDRFQVRLAISNSAAFAIYSAIVPLVFIHLGAIEAGKLGITLSIFYAIISVCYAPAFAATGKMASMIYAGESREAYGLLKSVLGRATTATALGGVCFLMALYFLEKGFEPSFRNRFAGWAELASLVFWSVATQTINCVAAFLRSFGEEPFFYPSIVGAVITLVGVTIGSNISAETVLFFFSAQAVVIGLPWSIFLLRKRLKRL